MIFSTGADTVLDAELVIDAMGRAARTPAFLDNLGYGRPGEHRRLMHVSYSSQLLRIPADAITEKLTFAFPAPGQPAGGAFSAYEDSTWMLSVGCLAEHEPPADLAGMITLAAQFAPPELLAALQVAEPLGEVYAFRYPATVWRRYDKMRRFPAGLLVFGNAICSFNPIYGQGMTVAALEALALRDCLSRGDGDLSRRFFRTAAKQIRPVWLLNQINDFCMSQVEGRPSVLRRIVNWRVDKVLAAAENDTVLTEALLRVGSLVDSPTRLLHPSLMMRVLAANRRRRAPSPG